ncbi:unnamed protein product [marine sediment metagenome]|uniref:Dehydrogenase E1 component domain-containing protein n=1 Tax=marine sediment metagenome TaxID=412755 RepID=X0SHV5_9ZZZZ
MKNKLLEMDLLTEESVKKIEYAVEKRLDEALKYAQDSPSPEPEDALRDVFA